MLDNQLDSFILAAKADPALMNQLDGTDDLDSVITVAREAGYTITADDLKMKAGVMDLSDEEFEADCCASTGTVKTGVSLCEKCS